MAGKPVWSRYGIEETNTAFVGILFTIYSILDESDDQIREIELGQGKTLVKTNLEFFSYFVRVLCIFELRSI